MRDTGRMREIKRYTDRGRETDMGEIQTRQERQTKA